MTSESKTPTKDSNSAGANKRNSAQIWLGLLTLLLAIAYVLPGLTGHDPWKQDEAYSYGIVHNMLESGDLIVPKLADDPFLEKPPLFYISAAGMVKLYQELSSMAAAAGLSIPKALQLPPHDAARLVSGVFLLILFGFTLLLGRAAWTHDNQNQGEGSIALLILIGTLGLAWSAHFLITDLALSAGVAMGLYGLVVAPKRLFQGGFWLGTGVGIAFLSKGLIGPGILAVTALLLPLFREWRTKRYFRVLLTALLFASPWLLIWPILLYLRDPALFDLWFWDNNIGRFLGHYLNGEPLGPPATIDFWLRTWPWVTFPAALLILFTLLLRVLDVWSSPGVRAVLVLSIVGWTVLFFSHTARDLYALPLLAPLAVLAAGAVPRLPRLIVLPAYALTVLLFGFAALLVWGVWSYHMFAGQPLQNVPLVSYLPFLQELPGDFAFVSQPLGFYLPFLDYLPADFAFVWQPVAFVTAALFTVVWVWIAVRFRPPQVASLLAWPAGIVMLWGLVAMLHLPWIDAAKSYRDVFTDLQAALPDRYNCIADIVQPETLRLRESERGLAHFIAGITTKHVAGADQTDCDLLLVEVQLKAHPEGFDPGSGWEKIWQGQRRLDQRDRFLLFQRQGSGAGDLGEERPDDPVAG